MENKSNLDKLTAILTDTLTKTDFVESFRNVVERIKRFEAQLTGDFRMLASSLNTKYQSLEQTLSQRILTAIAEATTQLTARIDAKLATIRSGIDGKDGLDGAPGKDADPTALMAELTKLIPPQLNVEDLRNGLEVLQGDDRLKMDAINGLVERFLELEKKPTGTAQVGWGAHPLVIAQSGSVKAKVARHINFKGTAVSSVVQNANGTIDVTLNSGAGAGTNFETPTGTIDDSNVAFTVANTPVYIVVNGAQSFSGAGYTYSAPTITLNNPIGTGGFIRSAY